MSSTDVPRDTAGVSGPQILDEGLQDWRLVLNRLIARFETGDFNAGTELVTGISRLADQENHHPDVDLRYPHVTVSLRSHDVGKITQRDVRLARKISELAAQAGVPAAAEAPDVIELALDTGDHQEIKPFWQALLGYQVSPEQDDELTDRAARNPSVWFQESSSEDPERQRWHLDVSVPAELAEARVQSAIEAGGRLVSDAEAPAFWVLADAQGNQACICSWQGRSAWAEPDE